MSKLLDIVEQVLSCENWCFDNDVDQVSHSADILHSPEKDWQAFMRRVIMLYQAGDETAMPSVELVR